MHGERPNDPKCVDKMGQIVTPADKIVFLENTDDRGWNMGSWLMTYGNSPGWGDPLAIFHNDRNTFSFADGHADRRKWMDHRTLAFIRQNAEDPSSHSGITLASPDNEDIQWLIKNFIAQNRVE